MLTRTLNETHNPEPMTAGQAINDDWPTWFAQAAGLPRAYVSAKLSATTNTKAA